MLTRNLRNFIRLETASGLLLFGALILALLIANSPFDSFYEELINLPIHIRIAALSLDKPLLLWVNEGFMALFFMLLALEIKRETIEGELSEFSQITLPVIAAFGGIILPALLYLGITEGDQDLLKGWPIATTTDIAFALGIISLLGKRVAPNLKLFLVALSIVDDILAIALIALFYTSQLSLITLDLAAACAVLLILLNRLGVNKIAPYILLGIIMWICVLKSGIHATLAGIVVGLCIPLREKNSYGPRPPSPLRDLEHKLHPWVAYVILPMFVFMNGGVTFTEINSGELLSALPLGIAAGLCLGKSLGVFTASYLMIKLGLAKMPRGNNWLQLYGISALTGVGFSMSLFLTALAFHGNKNDELARYGVLLGSFLSALLAILVFEIAYRVKKKNRHPLQAVAEES